MARQNSGGHAPCDSLYERQFANMQDCDKTIESAGRNMHMLLWASWSICLLSQRWSTFDFSHDLAYHVINDQRRD